MRTLLCISAIALLVACSDDRQTTEPTAAATPSFAATTNGGSAIVQAAAKPTSFAIFTATGLAETVFGDPGNQGATSTATCPAGSLVTGGGFMITAGYKDIRVIQSKPNATGTGWIVVGAWYGDDFNGTNYGTFSAVATCIK
jgi:hypothetical protein